MNTTTFPTAPRPHAPARAASPAADFTLARPSSAQQSLARAWLWLGLLALVGSGLFSILLVAARTPGVNQWLDISELFRVALVVHVDLSVAVWFAAMAGLWWSLNSSARFEAASWAALGLCIAGTALMCVAPFWRPGPAIMANYIPVLDGPLFLSGLALFAIGFALQVLRALLAALPVGRSPDGAGALRFGLNASVVSAAVAMGAFAWSLAVVPTALDPKAYYEILFWGGGHALQFVWTLLMLVAWLALAQACGARVPLSPRLVLMLLALALASVFVTPLAYLAHDVSSVEHRHMHTWAMRFGGGVAIFPLALAVALAMWRRVRASGDALAPDQRPLRMALLASMALFCAGGLIGLTISGSNVKIPAHYHGSIVGVTLALMGAVYLWLPRLGYAAPQGRLATWQPALYGAGQLMHIVGLVWSGGYGVQRKVAGAEQVLRSTAEVAGMGLMGLGGLLAIVGGLLFIVVVVRASRRPRAGAAHPDGHPRGQAGGAR